MNKYQSYDTYEYNNKQWCEQVDTKSDTRPDQTLSLQELLKRHQQGRPIEINKNLVYTGDRNLPDVSKMDYVDLKEAADRNRAAITKAQKELREQEQQIHLANQEAAWQKRFEENNQIKQSLEGKSTGIEPLDKAK